MVATSKQLDKAVFNACGAVAGLPMVLVVLMPVFIIAFPNANNCCEWS